MKLAAIALAAAWAALTATLWLARKVLTLALLGLIGYTLWLTAVSLAS